LLIPLATDVPASGSSPGSEFSTTATEIAFVVPGVPESTRVFWLSPVAFRPLPAHRVAGGTRIVVPAAGDGWVLITEDPNVVQAYRQRIARDASRAARQSRDLSEQRAKLIASVGSGLIQPGQNNDASARAIASAELQLRQCDTLISLGRVEAAHDLALAANQSLDRAAAEHSRIVRRPAGFTSHPLALNHDQLVEYGRSSRALDALGGGENLLYGGDFEDLGQMQQFGWEHVTSLTRDINSRAAVSSNQPKHGSYCLSLSSDLSSPGTAMPVVPSAPIWIVSPAIPLEQGQIVEIRGWVRIDEPIVGNIDGLQIVDSLGGAELSLAVRKTSGWQPFQMIRAAPEATELRLTFALAGLGSAQIDGVMVRSIQPPVARRLPRVSPADEPSKDNTAENSGPLFVRPETR
jgi:hypothetical protein